MGVFGIMSANVYLHKCDDFILVILYNICPSYLKYYQQIDVCFE